LGIPVFITKESIAKACRREAEGSFEENLDNMTSPWIEVVNMTLFNRKKKGKYYDMQKEHKLLQKILVECLLPKVGRAYQLSLEHRVFLHFLITLEKANVPKYIFNHMLWAVKESQDNNKSFIPYGGLLSDIFHQGGILKAVKMSKTVTDKQLGTITRKVINVGTLRKMQLTKEVIKLETDLQELSVLSNVMDDFPPICKEDPPDVKAHYVYEHWKATGETIKYDDIPDTMYGGALPVAPKKRKSKKQATSEDVDEEESSEPKPKKAKKEKVATQVNVVGSAMPTIQEETDDLEPVKIIK